MPIAKRNIAVCIILSIITCGIYGIYWFIVVTDEARQIVGDVNGTSGGVSFLLSLITCNLYGLYWAYKQGDRLDYAKSVRNIPNGSSNILYLILELLGFNIIAVALMQDSINKVLDSDAGYNS